MLGSVTRIDLINKHVMTDATDDIIKYTDLVIAVGSVGPFPAKTVAQKANEAIKQYKELGDEV